MEPRDLFKKVGGPVRLARALGYRAHSAVLKWTSIPAHHCPVIEAAFGIPRAELRPDLFGPLPAPAPAKQGEDA